MATPRLLLAIARADSGERRASTSTTSSQREAPVAGGAELVLAQDVDDYDVFIEPLGSTKIVYSQRRPDYLIDVMVVDLAYVAVGEQGLYAMDLP